jgi:hypothetical protein
VVSKGDKDVPFSAAEMAWQRFKSKSDAVYLKSVSEELDHTQALPLVLKEQLLFFKDHD